MLFVKIFSAGFFTNNNRSVLGRFPLRGFGCPCFYLSEERIESGRALTEDLRAVLAAP